jgi:hypothetical protein
MQQVDTKLRGVKKSVQAVTKAADKVEEITNVDGKPAVKAQVVTHRSRHS